MAIEPATDNEVERESAERIARMHRALAAAQDRYYWLDRWGIDLNALMQKRGAAELRMVLQGVRTVVRVTRELREREERARAGRPARQETGAEAGPTYYADVVVDALEETGMRLGDGLRGLGLGDPSDGVARVLGSAFPSLELTADTSPEQPPLAHGDESIDFFFAITPWSGFTEASAAEWLRELRRVIRPDGRLLLAARSAVLTPDRLLALSTPDWGVVLYRSRGVLGNQDLYVLEPR